MVYKQYPTKEEAEAVKTWLRWVLTDGQNINRNRSFARIDSSVTQRALEEIEKITSK
jgi:phosphate transport system substrate-binding protein